MNEAGFCRMFFVFYESVRYLVFMLFLVISIVVLRCTKKSLLLMCLRMNNFFNYEKYLRRSFSGATMCRQQQQCSWFSFDGCYALWGVRGQHQLARSLADCNHVQSTTRPILNQRAYSICNVHSRRGGRGQRTIEVRISSSCRCPGVFWHNWWLGLP